MKRKIIIYGAIVIIAILAVFLWSGLNEVTEYVLRENYDDNTDGVANIHGVYWASQTFESPVAHKLGKIALKLAGGGGGDPLETTITVGDTTLTQSINPIHHPDSEWVEFVFEEPVDIVAGQSYRIVVSVVEDENNWLYWRFQGGQPAYPNGGLFTSVDSGETWDSNSDDALFKEWEIRTYWKLW